MHKIEEYRSLREVVRLEKETVHISLYVLSGTLISAGLILNNSNLGLVISFLYQILLIWGLRRYVESTRLRRRIGGYLKVFIEPELDGINWEKLNLKFKKKEKVLPDWLRKWTDIFTLLSVLGIILTTKSIIENLNLCKATFFELTIFTLLIISHFIVFYLLYISIFKIKKADHYIEIWKDIKK